MKDISLEELLEAGCHFGHQVTRQNPKARDFVFEARDGIHIIDLAKTKEGLDEALAYVKNLASEEGSSIIVVGTKRQAAPIVEEEVKKAQEKAEGLFYVTKRWVGGTLTNTPAMQKNFAKLKDLQSKLKSDEEKENYTKKEIGQWEKELGKLQSFYSGIVEMKSLPSALFVVDTHLEYLAVREANRMGIPVVGIVDTNADPDPIQYVIPANDDAVGSLKLLISAVVDAWVEGKTGKEEKAKKAEKKTEKASTKEEKSAKNEEEARLSTTEVEDNVGQVEAAAEEANQDKEMTNESPVKTEKKKKVGAKK